MDKTLMTLFLFIFLVIFISFSAPGYAQWQKVESGIFPPLSFRAKIEKGQPYFYCRDKYKNFGIISKNEGCQLIYGSMLAKHDYEILVDPDQNLGWKWIKNGPIPLGAFDAGHAPLLGKKYLCLKPIRGKPYQGLVIGNQCHYRLKDQIHQTQTYQVLVQYWVKTKKIPPEVPASGRDESGDLYICRVQHHGIYYPGTTGVGVRSCKFIDEYGYEMVSKHYEVQLHLPHKWVKGHPERGLENMVNTGYQSKYYVCRAKFLRNVYIGKIQRGEPFCNVAIGGGQLNLKNYQLQIRTKQ